MTTMTTWVGTSWKMTKTLAQAAAYVNVLRASVVPDGVQAFVLPAHTALASVRDGLAGSHVLVGAQDACARVEGAVTGAVSMAMVRDAGARIVEIGHSERRRLFGETDDDVAVKVRAALAHDLVPLVCVGEPDRSSRDGRAERAVEQQVRASLSLTAPGDAARVLFAYEPVWAIGESGTPARPEEVAPIVAHLCTTVAAAGDTTPRAVLYGGSVDARNAAELLQVPHVDGLFVGRAAWDVYGFLDILALAGKLAPTPAVEVF